MSRRFTFKRFAVDDSRCGMKVGTDAVLLGCLAEQPAPEAILDIGTGCGLIALMLAQRFQNARVTGVDIDEPSALQAADNFARSPWAARLTSVSADATTWLPALSFDLIVSNPPYFENSFPVSDPQRKKARSQFTLDNAGLMHCASQWLNENGSFWFVSPIDYFNVAEIHLKTLGLSLQQRIHIHPSDTKGPNRVVACFTKKSNSQANSRSLSIRTAGHAYTADYLKLTKDFYLFA